MKRRSVAIIAIAALLGLALVLTGIYGPGSAESSTTFSFISTTSVFSSSSSQSTITTSSGSLSNPPSGALAILLTDPLATSGGASEVYMSYSGFAIHSRGSDASQGWIQLDASGTINLTKAVNATETVASTNVQVGSYDMARFNVTSMRVNYKGANYSASVLTSRVTARLIGELAVDSSVPSAALIDISPFVYSTGSASRPSFTVSASAVAFAVPPSEVTTETLLIGSRMSLRGVAWWSLDLKTFQPSIEIKSATLTSGSLNIAVNNAGGNDSRALAVIISRPTEAANANVQLPDINGTAIFTINENGSLHSVDPSANPQAAIREIVSTSGARVGTKSPLTLNYSGSISLSIGILGVDLSAIVPGNQYRITVVGQTSAASIVVVAAA